MKSEIFRIGDRDLRLGARTYVMGIINVTPDSFSGDGLLASLEWSQMKNRENLDFVIESALELGRNFVEAGVDILDIGGESTRPGSQPVSLEEELRFVIPVIETFNRQFDVIISIDTYKSSVAEAALNAGADMVNDVWALRADQKMASLIAARNVPVILMHNRSSWMHAEVKNRLGGRYIGVEYKNLMEDIKSELLESVSIAHAAGILDEKIILDPGVGFGKTVEQNLELIDRLDQLCDLGYPVLIGPSRKSFIGYTLDLPPEERLEGTASAVAISIDRGVDFIRVHDVKQMMRVIRMTDAIVRKIDSA